MASGFKTHTFGRHVENETWLSLLFLLRFFLFYFGEKKNLSPNFGMMVFFLDLVDFQSTGLWDFSSLFFDKRPLNVGRHVVTSFI